MWQINSYLDQLRAYSDRLQTAMWRFLVLKFLPILASNRLEIFRRLRVLITTFIWVGILLAVTAPFFHLVKMLALAGLLFDVAGVIRLFMDEEWDKLLEYYTDHAKYPHGPPSYITRELFADFNPEVAGDTPENSVERYFYQRRGFLLIIVGFICQAVAVVLA